MRYNLHDDACRQKKFRRNVWMEQPALRQWRRVSAEPLVMVVASVACLAGGVALAARAGRFGQRAAGAETLAGVLLILGLVLIGLGLPVFR
ncbi:MULTISPECIES: hypothetical protein [Methylobacteriaceae]|uniref:hypothetical protein n=1 Tax=Methylobacteriaceae TaxID=119045 RepID=UPI0011B3FE07|nr:hypothetical protein [Methylobacterium sp. B4]